MRRDTVKYIALLFCLTLVIPFLSGCNDTDDVQKIFTGKTWKMTYITKKNEHSWYKFTDVSEAIYKSYDPINGTKAFKIAFTGSTEDNIIRGEFSGSGSVTFTGTWQADGKSNEFRITGIKNQPSYGDSKDTLAKHIVEGSKMRPLMKGMKEIYTSISNMKKRHSALHSHPKDKTIRQ